MTNVNISAKNVDGKCDLKCALDFSYQTTPSLIAKNNGVLISTTIDSVASPPVTFNTNKYMVSKLNIVHPSFHLFNGNKVPGEIMVVHTPVLGGQPLTICIPIIQSGNTTNASHLIEKIIAGVASKAPSDGESASITVSDFTLNELMPKKPYFSYKHDTGDYVVFAPTFAVSLVESTINTLTSIVQPYAQTAQTKNGVFFNKNGPNSGVRNSGIYISCQPTGNSVENVDVVYDSAGGSSEANSFSNWFTFVLSSNIFKYFLIFILLLIGFYAINAMLTAAYASATFGKVGGTSPHTLSVKKTQNV
jgi:hypothetical protein